MRQWQGQAQHAGEVSECWSGVVGKPRESSCHVEVLHRAPVTGGVLLPSGLPRNSLTGKRELEAGGHGQSGPRWEQGVCLPGAGCCWERRLGFCAHLGSKEWLLSGQNSLRGTSHLAQLGEVGAGLSSVTLGRSDRQPQSCDTTCTV